ncbi:MAG: peptide chain release factor 1 [Chloroflexi bacterium]|nr:peptide chain release factor 1 [Chloroflexota bacterium]
MLEKLEGIVSRFNEIETLLATPEVATDYQRVAELSQERTNLEPIVQRYHAYRAILDELKDTKEMAENEDDGELRQMANDEIRRLEGERETLSEEIRHLLLPRDPRDDKNVIIEIRAGTGGDEAAIFAADLFRMYTRFAENQNWKVEILSSNEIGVGSGGYKEVVFKIKGAGAFSRLKYEGGVHRVQRVPQTESQGRVHTSTATVAVLAEMEAVDVEVKSTDLEVESYRAGGAGGQHVQKNDTAIRITHKPSGLVVQCQDERSKTQNLERAMAILRARLYDIALREAVEEQDAERRTMVGTGERSEKIRTYNYPQNRITDHRINLTTYNLSIVMDGGIDEFLDELATRDQAERLQAAEA